MADTHSIDDLQVEDLFAYHYTEREARALEGRALSPTEASAVAHASAALSAIGALARLSSAFMVEQTAFVDGNKQCAVLAANDQEQIGNAVMLLARYASHDLDRICNAALQTASGPNDFDTRR